MLLGPVLRLTSDHARLPLLHRVGNEPLTDFWTTGLSVWWVWCWGQSLSLPESVHIWAAATSGTIKAANKRNVGQADENSSARGPNGYVNSAPVQWKLRRTAEAQRGHNKDIAFRDECAASRSTPNGFWSRTQTNLLCLFFASVQEVSSAAWVIIDGLYSHFIFHWACNGVRISLSDALLAFYHLPPPPPSPTYRS